MIQIKEEFKKLIPALTNEEFKQLEANCLEEGIREKILTWNGFIIDGHNRYEIATKWDIDYQTESKSFKSEEDVKEWMILNQFGRRNLSDYQRSVLALELESVFSTRAKEQQVRKPKSVLPMLAEQKPIDTRKEISKIANVSHGTLDKVKVIEAKASEEVKAQLSTGEVSINQAYQEIKKEEKKDKKETERNRLEEIGKTKKIDVDLRLGDFEEVFKDIPDGSIDCIITDPPYPKEFIEVWSKLSRVAKRVLKPNGFCVAYSGQMYLPEVMNRMSENLDYYWTFAVYHEGQTQIVNGINLMCRWKPVLIFQNGKKKIENTFQDYFVSEQREKNGHDWQQSKSGVAYLIEMFTKKGDTILEPFAGSGTTMIAAREKGRNVIGAEIDEKTFNIAKALI
ncbi:MAG: DNA modification methylase [Cryomorphaceae bacterium]|nr:DNA modification methylase [Cryomorphaceae bacterium]